MNPMPVADAKRLSLEDAWTLDYGGQQYGQRNSIEDHGQHFDFRGAPRTSDILGGGQGPRGGTTIAGARPERT